MDHLQAIRIFARVVETGGFGRAAQSLQMPNATVSKWIRHLESHLVVKLLERSTRSVSITTDGAAYYERTRHLLAELDDHRGDARPFPGKSAWCATRGDQRVSGKRHSYPRASGVSRALP